MTMTYKTVTGQITQPGTNVGIRAKVTATPLTTNAMLTFTGDNRISIGPQSALTDSNGNLGTLKIPTNVDIGELYWHIFAESIDKVGGVPKRWTLKAAVAIDGTGTVNLRDLAEIDTTAVDSQIIVNISDLVVDAEGARDDAETAALDAESHKTAAASSATAAAGSATAASGSASTASTAASTATTKAGEAAASATAADTSADAAAADRSAVEDLVGAAEAVAVSNDTIIASRINDSASATAGALSASIDGITAPAFIRSTIVSPGVNGVTGLGVADDSVAINALLAANDGRQITFRGGGDYKISASSLVVPSGSVLSANGSVRLFNTSAHMTLIDADDAEGILIEGFELEGAGNSTLDTAGRAISQRGASSASYLRGVTLRDLKIRNFGYSALVTEFTEGTLLENVQIEHVGYAGVMGLSTRDFLMHGQSSIKDVGPGTTNAYGVIFSHSGDDLNAYPRSEACTVRDTTIEDIPLWDALNSHSGKNIRFESNTIRNCKRAVSMVGSFGLYATQQSVATGNKAYGCTEEAFNVVGAGTIVGTFVEAADGCEVSDNYLEDCGKDVSNNGGMVYYYTRNLKVTHNTIVRPVRSGVCLYHTNSGFTVTGNTIVDPHSASLNSPAVHITSQYNSGTIGGGAYLRVNTGLDTFVTGRGIRAETMSNNTLKIIPSHSTALVTYSGISDTASVTWGDIGTGASMYSGTATPEGVIAAGMGSLFTNINGGAGTTAYIKEGGSTGNTGWAGIPSRLSNTATLDFPSVAAAGSQELTITVTGAAVGNAVLLGPPSTIEAGLTWSGYVSATNTVKIRLTNVTASAIDPVSATWRASVMR